MRDSAAQVRDHPAPENPFHFRDGARRLLAGIRRVSGAWRLPSTWRATGNLGLWLALSFVRLLVVLAGLLAALATGWRTGPAHGIRASVTRLLSEMVSLDARRLEHFLGVHVRPLPNPSTEPEPSTGAGEPPASPLHARLIGDAFARAAAAGATTAAGLAWWWGTVLAIEIAVRRFELGPGRVRHYSSGHYKRAHVLGVLLMPGHISFVAAIVLAALGVIGLLLWPAVPRAASVVDVRVAQSLIDRLLGPSTEELTREVGRLSETRAQAVTASDAERRRIERDLHDGFQPQLVNLALNLGLARSRLATDPESARPLIERAHEDAKRATEDLRNLVRGIHPSVLDERGLDAAFSALAAESSCRLQIDVHLDERPPREVEAVTYFLVAETVTNVNKHAHAHTATVTVSMVDGKLRVIVHDDGRGGARLEPGGGLAGLADRLAGVDGTFSITSPEGGPTWIEARIPCER